MTQTGTTQTAAKTYRPCIECRSTVKHANHCSLAFVPGHRRSA